MNTKKGFGKTPEKRTPKKRVSEQIGFTAIGRYNNEGSLLLYSPETHLYEGEFKQLTGDIQRSHPFPHPGTFVFRGVLMRYTDGTGSYEGYTLYNPHKDLFDIEEYEAAKNDVVAG